MTGPPFGFGLPGDDDPERPSSADGFFGGPDNPFAALFGNDPNAMQNAFAQLGRLMSWTGGPVNWDLAQDTARKTVAAGSDPVVPDATRRAVEEAFRLAELWLDAASTFSAAGTTVAAWSRAEWIEATLPVWRVLVDPVAARVIDAMGASVPAEMTMAAGPLLGVIRQVGGAMFGAQVGQALGTLAGEVLGATDIGLPLGPPGRPALVPTNVVAFGAGLGIDAGEVRLFAALREAAHQRLFAGVPWLRAHLLGAVEAYANGITVDVARLEGIVTGLDPTNPEAISQALSEGMFAPQHTSEQQAALARLETVLALIEGWVDDVLSQAASALGSADALRESARRRRASGGPAEQTFGNLVGLELRPRQLREAAAFWAHLRTERGMEGRDARWAHPDLLPGADDLAEPAVFLAAAELDLGDLFGDPDNPDNPDDPDDPDDQG